MEKNPLKHIRITLEGPGYKYSLFEIKDSDIPVLLDKDRGILLRNGFRKYYEEDCKNVANGAKSQMLQFCTLLDDPDFPAKVSVIEVDKVQTYRLNNIKEWEFIVVNPQHGGYRANIPDDLPPDFIHRIKSIIEYYLDNADPTSIKALNGEYVTFFNLYMPEDKMMLCMRSRDIVRSEFEIAIPTNESLDIDKLNVLCRQAQEVVWHSGENMHEYDANSLIYDSRWHQGEVSSHKRQNVDYFVTSPNPTTIDARWFESWAV